MRLFVAVAEAGGFARAAQREHTVQSNVTAHIRKLESALESELFDRSGRRVSLTPAGRQLMDYARRILHLHDEAENRIAAAGEVAGPLRLGAMETAAAVRLPPMLRSFHAQWPSVSLSLNTGPTGDLVDAVLADELDAAFISGEPGDSRLDAHTVFAEELVLVTDVDIQSLTPADHLREHTLIAFRETCAYRRQMDAYLAAQGVAPRRILEFGTLDGMLGCVSAGMGATILPLATVQHHLSRYQLVATALPPEFARVTTSVIHRVGADARQPLKAFLELVEEHATLSAAAA